MHTLSRLLNTASTFRITKIAVRCFDALLHHVKKKITRPSQREARYAIPVSERCRAGLNMGCFETDFSIFDCIKFFKTVNHFILSPTQCFRKLCVSRSFSQTAYTPNNLHQRERQPTHSLRSPHNTYLLQTQIYELVVAVL